MKRYKSGPMSVCCGECGVESPKVHTAGGVNPWADVAINLRPFGWVTNGSEWAMMIGYVFFCDSCSAKNKAELELHYDQSLARISDHCGVLYRRGDRVVATGCEPPLHGVLVGAEDGQLLVCIDRPRGIRRFNPEKIAPVDPAPQTQGVSVIGLEASALG